MARRTVDEVMIKNVIEDQQDYIRTFITFSTPWGRHEAAAVSVQGYDEDHVSILSARAPLLRAKQILDAAP